jgi:hypothetical protein
VRPGLFLWFLGKHRYLVKSPSSFFAFRIPDDEQVIPPGYQYMDCHLVFDVKFDGFKFKARNDGADWSNFYGDVKEPIPPNNQRQEAKPS